MKNTEKILPTANKLENIEKINQLLKRNFDKKN